MTQPLNEKLTTEGASMVTAVHRSLPSGDAGEGRGGREGELPVDFHGDIRKTERVC